MGIRSLILRRKKSKSSPNSTLEISVTGQLPTTTPPVEELERVFREFDANGDGKISSSELGKIMRSLGNHATEDELQRMVTEADSDGDGFIDLNEFIELNTNGVDSRAVLEDLKHAFLIYDLDGNGLISPEELQAVLRNLGDNRSMEECKNMIKGVDFDGNGHIDFEEFKSMMTGTFAAPSKPTNVEDVC